MQYFSIYIHYFSKIFILFQTNIFSSIKLSTPQFPTTNLWKLTTNIYINHHLPNDVPLINCPPANEHRWYSLSTRAHIHTHTHTLLHRDTRKSAKGIYQIRPLAQRKINNGANKRAPLKNGRPISWRLIERSPLRFDRRPKITRPINEREKEERARFGRDTADRPLPTPQGEKLFETGCVR